VRRPARIDGRDRVARNTDALAWSPAEAHVEAELVRRGEGVAGEVELRWSVEPRGGYERAHERHKPFAADQHADGDGRWRNDDATTGR
jgi:hypothetical protein